MMNVFEEALRFAAEAHGGDFRKGTKTPYVTHVMEASLIVAEVLMERHVTLTQEDYEVMAAALLHDVIEDTAHTAEEIEMLFGSHVCQLVAEESENKREDLPAEATWKLRKQETIDHLARASEEVRLIALGDKLSNMRAMARDKRTAGDAMWQKFNNHDPKDHGWYYKTLGEYFAVFSDSHLYDEYLALCQEVFGQ